MKSQPETTTQLSLHASKATEIKSVLSILILLSLVCLPCNTTNAQRSKSSRIKVTEIKSPRLSGGWIVDLTGEVSEEANKYINIACTEIHERLGREMCVVVIPTTDGRNHRSFATNLFNFWGSATKAFLVRQAYGETTV